MSWTVKQVRDWDYKLLELQWSLNNSVHRITQTRSSDIVFKYVKVELNESPLKEEIVELTKDKQKGAQETDV